AAQVAGPALAGVVVAGGGAAWAIAIDAASYAVSAACLMALRLPPRASVPAEPFLQQLRLGWGAFVQHRWLWIIVLQFGFYHMLVMAPTMVLGALTAETRFGGASAWGLLLAAQGLGAVGGGLAAMRLRPARPLAVATLATFAGLPLVVGLACGAPLPVDVAAAALSGAGFAVFTLLFDTTMQREVPPEALSRVSSYDWLGSFAPVPVGYALVGPLSALLGRDGALWFAAGWLALSSTVVLAIPAVHGLRDPGARPG
ncbi:MFS transporter, partial [Lichenihabitans sp. Uapishka_5]|uniref:MFS transporter n=1 Tax=Lichenihabitans sp. Uapishka_5 TaxID=3037302 RepID=UPI0029E7CE51